MDIIRFARFDYQYLQAPLIELGSPIIKIRRTMICPYCEAKETKVTDSRNINGGVTIKRRRRCEQCHRRFTTFETVEMNMPNLVKSDGRREKFDRKKIINGLEKACQKRAISSNQIHHIIDNIEKNILEISDKEIHSKQVGSFVMQYLKNLDPVAYVRFASVYLNFEDIDEFLKDLQKEERNKK